MASSTRGRTRIGGPPNAKAAATQHVPLTAMVQPDIALITTVEPVHIEHFASVSAIADAKGEIFSGLEPGGVAILPRDNAHFERLAARPAFQKANAA